MNNFAKARPFVLELIFSNKHTTASVVQKATGSIVASASTLEGAVAEGLASRSDKVAAAQIGELLGERARAANIDGVEYLRPKGTRFHGKLKSLITSMEEHGLPLV